MRPSEIICDAILSAWNRQNHMAQTLVLFKFAKLSWQNKNLADFQKMKGSYRT